MAMNDLLSDMLARIKNGQKARLSHIKCPFSNLLSNVLDVLKSEGYINDWIVVSEGAKRSIEVQLKYYEGEPAIRMLKRVSKPGCREYSPVSRFKSVYNGLGSAVLSTDKGVVSDSQARKLNAGGEVLFYIF